MRVLLVGNGFAGSQLAYFLALRGAEVTVLTYSGFHATSSTNVSAGIMLPFTGRRKVLTFNAAKILPFAIAHYQQLESATGLSLIDDLVVRQCIKDAGDYNDWQAKSAEVSTEMFLDELQLDVPIAGLKSFFGYVQLKQSKAVKSVPLLEAVSMHDSSIQYVNKRFVFDLLKINDSKLTYQEEAFDYVLFCEGYRVIHNNFWNTLPFMPVKGEIIEIHAPGLKLDFIFNSGIYIIPKGNNRFLVGATYDWKNINELPSQDGLSLLIKELDTLLECDYNITTHAAGVRPAIQDRRPVIGTHPLHPRIGIFNGLGTKGAMLAPYYAQQFADHITIGTPIDEEVDVKRFSHLA